MKYLVKLSIMFTIWYLYDKQCIDKLKLKLLTIFTTTRMLNETKWLCSHITETLFT